MKKILLAVIIVFSAGISLNNTVTHVHPVPAIHISYFEYRKELASGD
jgi:hypothetical protein